MPGTGIRLSLFAALLLCACASGCGTGGTSGGTAGATAGSGTSSGGDPTGGTGGAGGTSTTGGDGGSDAGCTPGDGGDCPFCGAGNFVVSCPNFISCPRDATCGTNVDCVCNRDAVQLDCSGAVCSRSNPCRGTDWWCAPLQAGACGPQNFTVLGDGGACVTNSVSAGDGYCDCLPGFQSADCSGLSCADGGNCAYPNWWCVPATCGQDNFTVACQPLGPDAGTFYCPANSSCGLGCRCNAGFVSVLCDGTPCSGSGDGGCVAPNYWCVDAG